MSAGHTGRVILGPFNTDRPLARRSLRRLGDLDADEICFGHGQPLRGTATKALREACASNTVLDPLA